MKGSGKENEREGECVFVHGTPTRSGSRRNKGHSSRRQIIYEILTGANQPQGLQAYPVLLGGGGCEY